MIKLTKIIILLLNIFLISCAGIGIKNKLPETMKKLKDSNLYQDFSFLVWPGVEYKHEFISNTFTRTFTKGQVSNEKTETVQFKVSYLGGAGNDRSLTQNVLVTTSDKRGAVALRDLAFPEPGVQVPYAYDYKANILRAGNELPNSVFFIPPVLLPKGDVKAGDTWKNEFSWTTENGIGLVLDVVSILKSYYSCGDQVCADLELSGVVYMKEDPTKASYGSELAGRMIVSTKTGQILWEQIRTGEKLFAEGKRIEVSSCLESKMIAPVTEAHLKNKKMECDLKHKTAIFVDFPFSE
ncbi:MAG: hypothetical protein AB8E15_02300 [Bdellovibrionales bacterium]